MQMVRTLQEDCSMRFEQNALSSAKLPVGYQAILKADHRYAHASLTEHERMFNSPVEQMCSYQFNCTFKNFFVYMVPAVYICVLEMSDRYITCWCNYGNCMKSNIDSEFIPIEIMIF